MFSLNLIAFNNTTGGYKTVNIMFRRRDSH